LPEVPARDPSLPGRRWRYRLVAAIMLPLMLLGSVELILRLAGFGYRTSFFLEREQEGRAILIPNDHFGRRFFPEKVARRPTPFSVARDKAPGTYRIFLFGESAALGDPRPAYGMGRYLEAMLAERFPGTVFEVIPSAMTAINSHALRLMARECARYQGDLWIVYMGNNEMAGPFGAATIFGPQAPGLALVRSALAVRSTRTGQALDALGRLWGKGGETRGDWEGLRMFLEQQLPPDAPSRRVVHDHFRANLRDIVACGRQQGVPVLLCTVASNLRDCPPFASAHSQNFGGATSNQWHQVLRQVEINVASNRLAEAYSGVVEAERLDPGFAELRYRSGLLALALTNLPSAKASFEAARDFDALPFRADSALNEAVRDLAQQSGDGVRLVDLEREFSSGAIPGSELFLDHVHYTLDGNYQVALRLADATARWLPEPIRQSQAGDWPGQEVVERRLGLTDWNRLRMLESMMQRLLEPPYTNQLNHAQRLTSFARQILDLRPRLHPRNHLEAEDLYQEAIARAPRDPRLRENFAEFLEASDNAPMAIEEWRRVSGMQPWRYAPYFHLGKLLAREQKYPEAREAFDRCLALEPTLDEARLEIGQLLYRQGKHEEALQLYTVIRRQHPANARLLRHMADPLAATGRRQEAMECLREAVRLRPSFWEARYLLGVERAVDNQFEEAAELFAGVVQARPDHVLARMNLGVALVHLRRVWEARQQFEQVLRIEPQNTKAKQHLETLDQMLQAQPTTPGPG
jgi:tetratricopeptide (TPR) repeat protein